MTRFAISSLQRSSAWFLFRMRDRIKMDPVYQRQGDIWNLEKRQLLIDTMINGFDVPKLYLHKFPAPQVEQDNTFDYAMIDGKQRAEAIFQFIENQFALHDNFTYLADEDIDLSSLTYRELATNHPDIKQDFDAFTLDVISIETDDTELIEDLFSRLNEAMPLNAAEKRNAKPGPLPQIVRAIARHRLFSEKVPFGNSRYRHYDIIAKMLLLLDRDSVGDTKKAYLDRFFEEHARSRPADVAHLRRGVVDVLNLMVDTFVDKDFLLRSVGMISLYFLIFERAIERNLTDRISRADFHDFEEIRYDNRQVAEEDISEANYNLLEFDRFAQSPNDGIALRFRLAVIDTHLYSGDLGFAEDGVLEDEG